MATQAGVLQSLLAAAEAAQSAYLTARAANPSADLSALYAAELQAQQTYFVALNKTFTAAADTDAVQQQLDALTSSIKAELSTITNVSTWVTLVSNLVQLATSLGTLFV